MSQSIILVVLPIQLNSNRTCVTVNLLKINNPVEFVCHSETADRKMAKLVLKRKPSTRIEIAFAFIFGSTKPPWLHSLALEMPTIQLQSVSFSLLFGVTETQTRIFTLYQLLHEFGVCAEMNGSLCCWDLVQEDKFLINWVFLVISLAFYTCLSKYLLGIKQNNYSTIVFGFRAFYPI